MKSETPLLKFAKRTAPRTTQSASPLLRRAGLSSLIAAAMLGTLAHAQIAPRYKSPLLEAPQPQTESLPAPAAISPNATVVEYPIARVNDQIIDNSDYQRAERELLDEAQRTAVSPADLAQRQKDLLRDMIDQQLLLSRGKELDVNADSEVIRRLDDIRKQNHMETMEDLEKAVRQSGISYEDFKSNIKNGIITQQVVHDEVGRKLSLSARQEQAYYDEHKQEFALPEQVRLSEILIPTAEDATDAQIAAAQAKANEVAAKLKAGAKFEDLAKQYSGGQTADKGGDLGDFKRGALAKVLEDQTFSLKPGEFTAPIRTRQGFVVLQVTEHTQSGIPPLSAVENQVQEAIYQAAIQPALRTYLTDLREKAFIEIQPGFTDSGASPRETKAVFTANTPPPVKRKSSAKARLDRSAVSASASKPPAIPSLPPAGASASLPATPVSTSRSKKPRRIKREKIRFGQAPRTSLPTAPEETTSTAGADEGVGAASSLASAAAPGAAMTSETASVSSDTDPLAAQAAPAAKTRYSARAPIEAKLKADAKAAKVKQKIAATPAPLTAEDKATQQTQNAALGLGQDTTPKKKKKVKGAPKERIQEKAPTPVGPAPVATPIPPKSVRDNGEPAVRPAPDPSTLPTVTAPAPGAPVDMHPATPAQPAGTATPQ